jgi:hypothetical protein
MSEPYPTRTETDEFPPLPPSAWSLETLMLYNTKPSIRTTSLERNDANPEQLMPHSPYQSHRSGTSTSSQPASQLYFAKLQRSCSRRPRHKRQQSTNQDAVREKSGMTLLARDRTQGRTSPEAKSRGHHFSSQKGWSRNRTSRTTDSIDTPRLYMKSSSESHSNHRRSRRKHRNHRLRAPSYTILQWILWKLCGS